MTAAVSLRAPVALRTRVRQTTAARASCATSSSAAPTPTASSCVVSQRRSCAFGGAAIAIRAAAPTSTSRKSVVVEAAGKDGGEESTANISRKVARTAGACKTLGRWGFWSQLVLTTISAVILVFSFLFKGFTKVRHDAHACHHKEISTPLHSDMCQSPLPPPHTSPPE
jgi:hypothetical protein